MRGSQSSRCSAVKCIGSMPSLTPNARSRCRITAKMEPNSYVAKHEVNPQSRACCRDDNRAGVSCALAVEAGLSRRPDQTVTLRPGRLCHSMVALDLTVEQPGERLRLGRGMRARRHAR